MAGVKLASGYWRMRDGTEVRQSDMEAGHLISTLRMIERIGRSNFETMGASDDWEPKTTYLEIEAEWEKRHGRDWLLQSADGTGDVGY